MSNTPLDDPHRTRTGSAAKAGPSGRINHQTTDSPGKWNRGEPTHETPAQVQSLTNANPRVKQRVKQFRISHLNCRKSRMALDELTLVRSRDDALLITEPPITDGTPPDLTGYVLISSQGMETRTCIYIREWSMTHTSEHTPEHLTTSIKIDGRTVRCIYDPPKETNRNPHTYDDMEEGEIRMGDYNATHPRWMEGNPITERGKKLLDWIMNQTDTEEVGPREPTHTGGNKLDLIFTRDTEHHMTHVLNNGNIKNSDHKCQSIKIQVKYTETDGQRKTNYRKVDTHSLTEKIKTMSLKTPTNPEELIDQLEQIRATLLTMEISDRPRLAKEVLDNRRTLNRATRSKRAGKHEIRELRIKYRQSIRDYHNKAIDTILEESNDNDKFFQLSKRGKQKKAIPPQLVNNRLHRTHDEICEAMANHHGANDISTMNPEPNSTEDWAIEPVLTHEIHTAITKAPPNSTLGIDDIGAILIKSYAKANPGYFENIFTDILRTGRHPEEWKKAIVVPIPKANKPRYDHPKSWRSLHLLSTVSKTLERVVLNRLQEYGDKNNTLGATQFGSQRHTGTSDAYQIYKEWVEDTKRKGMLMTCILTDIEGGFDKVRPENLDQTGIDPKYLRWIKNWARDRRIRFRLNGRMGKTEYVTNRGLPQGSPLSPYIFGAYVKGIANDFYDQNVFIISYVDDLLTCIRVNDLKEVEEKGRAAWQRLKERAAIRGMDFAENKTKMFHRNHDSQWKIGHKIREMRFLGYWDEATTSDEDPTMEKHVRHWLTKANFTYNVIRAITQRTESDKGLNTMSTIRLLHSVTRTIAWYGLEHYGHIDDRNKELDSFLYETVKRLLDMPLNTPHRSISAEFGMTPTKIQYHYLVDRTRHRHSTFPYIMARARIAANLPSGNNIIDHTTTEELAPWTMTLPDSTEHTTITIDTLPPEMPKDPANLRITLQLSSHADRIVYTDGSKKPRERPSYGIAMFNASHELIQTDSGKLSAGKDINDAETMAIYKAMELVLNEARDGFNYGRAAKVVILSDSKTGIDAVANPRTSGPLAYLNIMRKDIDSRDDRHRATFTLGWIKGHSNIKGNDIADKLAKEAKDVKDPLPYTTHGKRLHDISANRQTAWETWFREKKHTYRGLPSRRLKRHRGLTRKDTSILFRLKTNKGWTDDTIGIQEPPTCDADGEPDDGTHKFTCQKRAEKRPHDIEKAIRDPKNQHKTRNDTLEWIRHHDHFGFRNKIYEVNYIKLRIGQYNREKDLKCHLCDAVMSRKDHLARHIDQVHDNPSTKTKHNPKLNPLTIEERKCHICNKEFTTRKNIEKHLAAHNKGTLPTDRYCNICDITLTTKRNMEKHTAAHEKGTVRATPKRCEECKKIFDSIELKEEHQEETCGGLCHGCSKEFRSRKELKEHQRSNCGGSRS